MRIIWRGVQASNDGDGNDLLLVGAITVSILMNFAFLFVLYTKYRVCPL